MREKKWKTKDQKPKVMFLTFENLIFQLYQKVILKSAFTFAKHFFNLLAFWKANKLVNNFQTPSKL